MELLIVLFVIFFVYNKYLERTRNNQTTRKKDQYSDKVDNFEFFNEAENTEACSIDTSIDYVNSYQARYVFSKNEWHQYMKLKEIADVRGFVICPKVRLLDIIEPRKGAKKYKTLFYKIQAKHVDFLICDQKMYIKAIIELDDNSHNQTSRKERDDFVDSILRSVGYKVIHTKYITNDILDLV